MGSAENGGRWHPAPEGRQNGPPLDIYDTIPNTVLRLESKVMERGTGNLIL